MDLVQELLKRGFLLRRTAKQEQKARGRSGIRNCAAVILRLCQRVDVAGKSDARSRVYGLLRKHRSGLSLNTQRKESKDKNEQREKRGGRPRLKHGASFDLA